MCIRDRSKPINEVANRGLTGAEGVKKSTTAAFSDSVERIGRRRRAGHADIICRYRYMSTQHAATHKCPAVIHGNKRTGDGNPGRPLAPLRAGGDDPRNRCVSAWLVGDAFTRVVAISGQNIPNPILSLLLSLQTRRQVSTAVAGDLRVPRGGPI